MTPTHLIHRSRGLDSRIHGVKRLLRVLEHELPSAPELRESIRLALEEEKAFQHPALEDVEIPE